tara:strand:+ start:114 stop:755 length:642 start_codon:yes stop_codon:yes gene_type:complete
MTTRTTLWLVPALVYAAFAAWYTDFGGPLGEAEITRYADALHANGVSKERVATLTRFMQEDNGNQFLMVNALELNPDPPDVPDAEPGASAEQLMARYMAHMLPALLKRACHPVLSGDALFSAMDVVGIDNAEQWQSAAVVRYRSRRSFMQIVSDPVFREQHHFKTAALKKTIAYPIDPQLYLSDPRLLLALLLVAITALLDAFLLQPARRPGN